MKLLLCLFLACPLFLHAAPNLQFKTMGGTSFWADTAVQSGWRVQRNCVTGHHRLLDDKDVRQAWGSADRCLAALEKQAPSKASGEVVISMHGLFDGRRVMKPMNTLLREQGYTVVSFGYPSTRDDIASHATHLDSVIEHLGPGVTKINFVAHSLGNLVIREYLKTHHDANAPQLGRFVMVTPPNQGADTARMFEHVPGYSLVLQGVGRDLASRKLDQRLGSPRCQFGIIIGAKGNKCGWNPLIKGDDDAVVRVEETRLAGTTDTITFKVRHKPMMKHRPAHEATLRFLQTGRF